MPLPSLLWKNNTCRLLGIRACCLVDSCGSANALLALAGPPRSPSLAAMLAHKKGYNPLLDSGEPSPPSHIKAVFGTSQDKEFYGPMAGGLSRAPLLAMASHARWLCAWVLCAIVFAAPVACNDTVEYATAACPPPCSTPEPAGAARRAAAGCSQSSAGSAPAPSAYGPLGGEHPWAPTPAPAQRSQQLGRPALDRRSRRLLEAAAGSASGRTGAPGPCRAATAAPPGCAAQRLPTDGHACPSIDCPVAAAAAAAAATQQRGSQRAGRHQPARQRGECCWPGGPARLGPSARRAPAASAAHQAQPRVAAQQPGRPWGRSHPGQPACRGRRHGCTAGCQPTPLARAAARHAAATAARPAAAAWHAGGRAWCGGQPGWPATASSAPCPHPQPARCSSAGFAAPAAGGGSGGTRASSTPTVMCTLFARSLQLRPLLTGLFVGFTD